MEDQLKPEVGDLIEWGEATMSKLEPWRTQIPRPRGLVKRIYKDGRVLTNTDTGGKDIKLMPHEFTVISKAG